MRPLSAINVQNELNVTNTPDPFLLVRACREHRNRPMPYAPSPTSLQNKLGSNSHYTR